jgi:hypothetical protein
LNFQFSTFGFVPCGHSCSSQTTFTDNVLEEVFHFWRSLLAMARAMPGRHGKNHYTTSLNQSQKKEFKKDCVSQPTNRGAMGVDSRKRGSLFKSAFSVCPFARLVGGKNKTQCG